MLMIDGRQVVVRVNAFHSFCRRRLLPLAVRLNVESGEQVQEGQRHQRQDDGHLSRHIAVDDAGHTKHNDNRAELNQLQSRQVFLPPQELLHLRSHGGEQVIAVHNNVHEGVDEANRHSLLSKRVLQVVIGPQDHNGVMVNVQEGDLSLVLAQDKEDRVQELNNLRDVVPVCARVELQE